MSDVVIDQLFPPTCVACDQPTETPVGLCSACWRDTFFLSGHLCDCCGAALKHSDRTDLAPALAQWLSGAVAPIMQGDEVIVPVPLHRVRLLKRRYNQAAELGRALARRIGMEFMPNALLRTIHTPPQKGKRDARFSAMQGAFSLNPRQAPALKGRRILLLDDVITTGATLSACAETLRTADPAVVNVLALARVLRDA